MNTWTEAIANNPKKTLLIAAVAIAGGFALRWVFIRHFVEQPNYEVVRRFERAEVRRYQSSVVAEVDVEGEMNEASSEAFGMLAGYIFGGNTSQTKIDMTAPVEMKPVKIDMTTPVAMRPASSDRTKWTMSFTMPAEYSLETLPQPKDPRVRLRRAEPRDMLALRFSGTATDEDVGNKIRELRSLAKSKGITVRGEPVVARYDPPSTPGFLRRNEIMFAIARSSKESMTR